MTHSGDEFYGDEITSGPNLEDLHGQDWNEANEYARELDDQPGEGEPPEEAPEDGGGMTPPEEDLPF
jgi:hypothetical protein